MSTFLAQRHHLIIVSSTLIVSSVSTSLSLSSLISPYRLSLSDQIGQTNTDCRHNYSIQLILYEMTWFKERTKGVGSVSLQSVVVAAQCCDGCDLMTNYSSTVFNIQRTSMIKL